MIYVLRRYFSLMVLAAAVCLTVTTSSIRAYADTASVQDDCAILTITSSEPGSGGEYYIDIAGTLINGYYYMAYLYMDNVIVAQDFSFWGNSFSKTEGPFTDEHLFKLYVTGGTTHGICNSSVELTAGGGSKDPVKMSEDICSAINELGDGTFKNNPSQRKNALCSKLEEIAALADYAANATDPVVKSQFYLDAIEKVANDVGAKTDGSFGGLSNNDWITDSDAQAIIYPMVNDLRETMQGLL